MNDMQEITKGNLTDWKSIYISSFAYGKSENIAMWGIYGLPHNEAASISFPSKIFSKWIPVIKSVYDPENNYKEIDAEFEIQLTDVVYAGGKRGSDDQILKWNDKSLMIEQSANPNNLRFISSEEQMTGYIKNYAWAYENEVRIRIKLDKPIAQKRIAIKIPEEFFSMREKAENVKITYGPWNQDAVKEKKIQKFEAQLKADTSASIRIDNIEISTSEFTNLVRLKETCACCQLFMDNNRRIKRKAPSIFQDIEI